MIQPKKPSLDKAKVSPELRHKFKKFRERTLDALIRTGNYTKAEVLAKCEDPDCNAIEAVVARTYAKAFYGSAKHTSELYDRILGPIINTLVMLESAEQGSAKTVNPDAVYNALMALKQAEPEKPCVTINQEQEIDSAD
jgi:hypothetical protein